VICYVQDKDTKLYYEAKPCHQPCDMTWSFVFAVNETELEQWHCCPLGHV